ncbi:MAG: hypothetical protein ABH860_05965 [bacterium]
MLEAIYMVKSNIYFTWFALLVFFAGFCFSYLVNYFDIKFLAWFPDRFLKFMSKYVNPRASFLRIFLIIFLFNSISIAIYMISGLFVILPFIIAFLTGMNIGLTVFIPPKATIEGYEIGHVHGAGNMFIMVLFSTFVMMLEVITFSLALGMGMSFGVAVAAVSSANPSASAGASLFLAELLTLRLRTYMLFCVPVLAVSASLEASVIKGT